MAGVAVGVIACADQSNPLGIAPSFDQHGSRHGSEHSGHPWTGRSGSAAITAYALFGTSATNLIVTAYRERDSLFTKPVGCIDKIQVKVYNAQGRLVSTQNFNGLERHNVEHSVTVRVRGAQVGYRLALHVNVSCIDRHRTDVVEADVVVIAANTTDPAVIRLKVPGEPLMSAPVTISAYVKVTRGLAAATGNCALYVNAVQVATLLTVTVAAGDSVPCTFTPSFGTEGTVQVTVAFENIVQTDLSYDNNSASTWMPVYSTRPTWSRLDGEVYEDVGTSYSMETHSLRWIPNNEPATLADITGTLVPSASDVASDNLPPLLAGKTYAQILDILAGKTPPQRVDILYPLQDSMYSLTDVSGTTQHAQVEGIIDTRVRFPLAEVSVLQTSGAMQYHRGNWLGVEPSPNSSSGAECAFLEQGGAVSLSVCGYPPETGFP
ncbi:MAG: hypothetical protein NTY23_14380, partial [Chloroflexi bacterium]|nr:hypothetical protein [Chloroflexota bacterium]